MINERINKENKVKNDKNINDNYNNYIINNTNPKSIKKHIKILRSSENFNKIRIRIKSRSCFDLYAKKNTEKST